MSQVSSYGCMVIGSGQAGTPLALELARAGHRTALIERSCVGGSCVNYGCTPTKSLLASARVAHLAGRADEYGLEIKKYRVNMEAVRQRREHVVDQFRKGILGGIEETNGLDLIRGQARFVDDSIIEVIGNGGRARRFQGRDFFINTGTRPHFPPIKGLNKVQALDSTTIQELAEVPEKLLIVGGGYIGVEFGQMFCRFGSQVTLVQRGSQVLSPEDSDVAEELAQILREEGIDLRLQSEVTSVERSTEEGITCQLSGGEGVKEVQTHQLLIAAGRIPNSDGLGLDRAGVECDEQGYIRVNAKLRTTNPHIYALGDVKGGPGFTHISYDDFRVLRSNYLEGEEASIDGRPVPYTVFTDPQLGRVGLSEKEARDKGESFRVAKLPMSRAARAIEVGETRGFMKALVQKETDQILGCAILGIDGGEIMAVLQVAMMAKVPYTQLRDGIFAHPTLAESLNNLFQSFED